MNLISSEFKIKVIKKADSFIGSILTQLLSSPITHQCIKVRSILVIRPGGIGDALLLAPALNQIKASYSDASITILAEGRNAGAFALIPAVDRVLLYDSCKDLSYLLRSKYDLIIDTEQWHRMSAVIARMIPSSMKIGFATNERKKLFTHPVPYSLDDYEAQSFLNLLNPLEIKEAFDHSVPFLYIPDSAVNETDSILKLIKTPYVCIFTGASVKERRWGIDKFKALIQSIADSGVSIVIIGGKEDKDSGEKLLSGSSGLNLAGKTSIAGTAAVIAGSRLLISGDSGVLHIGVGLCVPTVSLFGAGNAKKWAPHAERNSVLNRNLHCSPCTLFGTTPVCSYETRCLSEIKVAEVYEAVDVLLNQ